MKLSKDKLAYNKGYKILRFIVTSAPFAMLLSIVFFWFETYRNDQENDKMIDNLKQIEQSLSTRHIGIFPAYLDEINKLLSETPRRNDTTKIIIFEDVLFYGAFYNGSAFKDMIKQLAELSNDGKRIVIAYYDNSKERGKGQMFREVVQESWMHKTDLSLLSQKRGVLIDSLRKIYPNGNSILSVADSIACEEYFVKYRDDKRSDFLERRDKILIPLYDPKNNDNLLFKRIDDIKNRSLNKPVSDITFSDMYVMYYDTTEQLKAFLYQYNIETIPLNDYLTMSCWSNGEKVLFAFPGKFAADEIGFISHDLAILSYINTMLEGAVAASKENAL